MKYIRAVYEYKVLVILANKSFLGRQEVVLVACHASTSIWETVVSKPSSSRVHRFLSHFEVSIFGPIHQHRATYSHGSPFDW